MIGPLATFAHSRRMTERHVRVVLRQPGYVAITLVQPVIWLLLFGALFKRVVEIPGFGGGSYLEFMTPGVVVMTALFSNGWTGMSIIDDLDSGVMDRFLVSPVKRSALMNGPLASASLSTVVQTLIILGLAVISGARFGGGVAGVAVMIGCAVLLGWSIGAFSNGVALIVRRRESVIAMVQFIVLPATFLSGAIMHTGLTPEWIQQVARYNPVNWASQAGREALASNPDWGFVAIRLVLLLGVALACSLLATRAFSSYQKSC